MTVPGGEARINYLRPINLRGIEFLAADNDQALWHVFHERYVICAGGVASVRYRYRGKTHAATDGMAMLMEPGEPHRNLAVPRPQSFRVLFIDPERFREAANQHAIKATPHFAPALVGDAKLLRAIYGLYASIEAPDTLLEQQSRLAQCLRLALGHVEGQPPAAKNGDEKRALGRVRAYIADRFNEPVSLDELAILAGLSPYHLIRSFTRLTGLPPHAYQIHIRIERARELLIAGVPPAETASLIGFADQSHFTRHFRRIMQVTPARYARAVR